MRTCGSDPSDSSINMRLPPFSAQGNVSRIPLAAQVPRTVPQRDGSCDDVGDVRIGNSLDLVLQSELALFQPCKLELIGGAARRKRCNLRVERAVLGFKCLELSRRTFVIVHNASVTESPGSTNLNPSSTTRMTHPASGEMGQDKRDDS
jgi:hypothetical protein